VSPLSPAPPDRIEFPATQTAPVVAALEGLVVEGGGWINLFPEVMEGDVERVTPSAVGLLFRAAGPPIPQATIIAPARGRRATKPGQVGLTHGVGTKVLPRLAAEGIARPDGWTMVQDHVRRGVVLRVDEFVPGIVVEWSLRAASALCPVPLTGGWLAEVHHPSR
jgi:hypothetical protein